MAQGKRCTIKRRLTGPQRKAAAKRTCSRTTTGRETCQVNGCQMDLSTLKEYHRRYRICDVHMQNKIVEIEGVAKRFCQQCARFQLIADFEPGYRSCRASLEDHNARRRVKSVPIPVASGALACHTATDSSSELTVADNVGSGGITSVQAATVDAVHLGHTYQSSVNFGMTDEPLFHHVSSVSEYSYQSSSTQGDVSCPEWDYEICDFCVVSHDFDTNPCRASVSNQSVVSCATSSGFITEYYPDIVRKAYHTFQESEYFFMEHALSLAMFASSTFWHPILGL